MDKIEYVNFILPILSLNIIHCLKLKAVFKFTKHKVVISLFQKCTLNVYFFFGKSHTELT